MKIALDAFGGDFAPEVNIRGSLDFVGESRAEVILTGPEEKLKALLGKGHPQISIVDAPDLIDMAEKASAQLRNKKKSSMYKCVELVDEGVANACISAGSSAAMMALSVLLFKRLKDVERPALITPVPTLKEDPCYCLDMGANVDCKPIHLLHFALMGHAYAQVLKGIPRPRIGLISNGEEESKGNELCRETHQLIKQIPNINYGGYCEGRDIFSGDWDVVVCDGFVGNVILKTAEGLGEAIMELLKKSFSSSIMGSAGYLLARSSLKPLKKKLDYAEYGAAPLLGVGGVSLISHGRSNQLAIKNALHSAERNHREGLVQKLSDALDLVNLNKSATSSTEARL